MNRDNLKKNMLLKKKSGEDLLYRILAVQDEKFL